MVVVNRNNRERLQDCLFSLRRQTYPHFHVIVVDNASIDGSVEMLDGQFGGFAYIIKNSKDQGFCTAVNQGIRASKSAYVALLSNDSEADPRWLEIMVRTVEQADDIGMCVPKLLRFGPTPFIDKIGHLIYPDGQTRGRAAGQMDRGQFEEEEEVLFPDGCAALYRRAVFETVGLFDEDFFVYGEAAELGFRARLAGWRAMYCPRAIACHHHAKTLGAVSPNEVFFVERNRIWLAVKLFPWDLLLLNPFFSTARMSAGMVAGIAKRGPAGEFVRAYSFLRLVWTILCADWAALVKFPRVLRKRSSVRKFRKLTNAQVRQLLKRYRISLRELIFESIGDATAIPGESPDGEDISSC